MPLRIVIDVRDIDEFGIGTYTQNLLRALGEIDRENSYVLAGLKPDLIDGFDLPSNFEAAVFDPPKYRAAENLTFPLFLKSLKPDLVHIPLNQVPLFTPRPYVVTIHDMSSFLFEGGKGLKQQLELYRFRRGIDRAARVIAVSASTRRDLENSLGVPSARIRQVYSAPDPRFLINNKTVEGSTAENTILERYQIQYPYLLYAGRIRPHKNIPRIIEAFAVVRAELEDHPVYKDLRLIIIGDEITRHPEVRRTMVQTRTQQTVRFLGFVPFETLKIFYARASAFVFPSLYEGFGLPPLEAMATGTPVITSAVSSLSEVAGDAAMIVNPENPFDIARGIREVLVDQALRKTLIAKGHEQVSHFNWTRTAEQVLDVYRSVSLA